MFSLFGILLGQRDTRELSYETIPKAVDAVLFADAELYSNQNFKTSHANI